MIEYIQSKAGKKQIIAVGNPPYQESDGGAGASASQIYNCFIENLIDSNKISQILFVIPARWMSAGKGLDKFRNRIMDSLNIRKIKYFTKAETIFPTVQIKGGICFLHWDSLHNGKTSFSYENKDLEISLNEFDIIPDDPWSASIINKITNAHVKSFISESAWPGKPFGLRTFYFDRNPSINPNSPKAIACYTKGRIIKYVDIDIITKNKDKIKNYKVVIPRAYGKGMKRCTIPKNQIFILEPNIITTETYNVVGCFKSKKHAVNYQKYLQTDFARYLLGLRKITQDIPRDKWSWVPNMDVNTEWTDNLLFEHFNLTKEESSYIKKKVQEWS